MSTSEGRAVRAQVARLLDVAGQRYADTAATPALRAARERIDAPLRVALAGKVKSGKSTLLNALVGERLAATDSGECTRIVTWYREGLTYGVVAHAGEGVPAQPLPFRRDEHAVTIDLLGRDPAGIDHLVVEWPSVALRAMTLIDTPGIGSSSTGLSARTHEAVAPDDRSGHADAVCYLMRHLHAVDVRFLEAFRDDVAGAAAPMNAVGVLSRADEVGAGRLAALESAARIARRYRRDPQVSALCQTVLPVAGLLAETGATLREDEFRALRALVAVDRAALQRLLLSADRFGSAAEGTDVGADVRRALLSRLGVFGIRLSLALIRSGQTTTASALAAALVERSGVNALRDTLLTQFAARADLLKARSGLAVLSAVLTRHPLPDTDDLAIAVEQIITGTHAFAEARLLNALRAGDVAVDDATATEAERLLGGHGDDLASRLGLGDGDDQPGSVAATHVREAVGETLIRWRRRAEHPLATRATSDVAAVVVRSCEGMLAALAAEAAPPARRP